MASRRLINGLSWEKLLQPPEAPLMVFRTNEQLRHALSSELNNRRPQKRDVTFVLAEGNIAFASNYRGGDLCLGGIYVHVFG